MLTNFKRSPKPISILNRRLSYMLLAFFISSLFLLLFSSCKTDDKALNQDSCCDAILDSGADRIDKPINADYLTAKNKIELHVLAGKLFNASTTDNDEVIKYTKIVDDKKQAGYGQAKKDFTTDVEPMAKIKWTIKEETESNNTEKFRLEMVSIGMKAEEYNVNFFSKSPLLANKNKIEAEVEYNARASDSLYSDDQQELQSFVEFSYYIIFSITNKKGITKNYSLDPRLKMPSTIAQTENKE